MPIGRLGEDRREARRAGRRAGRAAGPDEPRRTACSWSRTGACRDPDPGADREQLVGLGDARQADVTGSVMPSARRAASQSPIASGSKHSWVVIEVANGGLGAERGEQRRRRG